MICGYARVTTDAILREMTGPGERSQFKKLKGKLPAGEVILEDIGDAIVPSTLDRVVARAQALSRKLLAGQAGASVEDCLADRACEAETE